MTMGTLISWNGISGLIEADDKSLWPVHIALMPYTRALAPHVGQRVAFGCVPGAEEPPHAHHVWAVLSGSKPSEEFEYHVAAGL